MEKINVCCSILAAAALLLALSACGGGGGTLISVSHSGPDDQLIQPEPDLYLETHPKFSIDETAEDMAGNEPIWYNVRGVPLLIGTLESAEMDRVWGSITHGSMRIGSTTLNDGVTASQLISLLRHEANLDDEDVVVRWQETPPIVRMGASATAKDRRDILLAVRMINSALPSDWQVEVRETGADVPHGWRYAPSPTTVSGHIATDRGYIDILFAPRSQWIRSRIQDFSDFVGVAFSVTDSSSRIVASRIYVDPIDVTYTKDRVHVLLHEILHSLGRHHPNHERFPDTIMHKSYYPSTPDFLSPLDEATLLAVFEHLDVGTSIEDNPATPESDGLSEGNFGSWSDAAFHVFGELDHKASAEERLVFGAVSRNGFSRPYLLAMDPAPELTGTAGDSASWSGRLIGLTPVAEPVAGSMDMTVSFGSSVSGTIDFTGLEFWSANTEPGAVSTGTRWTGGNIAGELHYGIRVDDGLVFVETGRAGSDDGQITGQFFGKGHEGAGGTLKRTDLAAGFGGVRN